MRSQFLSWDMESIKNFYANWTQNTTVMGLMTFALLLRRSIVYRRGLLLWVMKKGPFFILVHMKAHVNSW